MSRRSVCIAVAVCGYAALLLGLSLGETAGRVGVAIYLLSTCVLVALWLGQRVRLARTLALANVSLIAVLAAVWGFASGG
jgi:hypothetical protein